MSLENGHRIIFYFSEKYALDENRTRILIAEFEATQRQNNVLTERDTQINRKKKR